MILRRLFILTIVLSVFFLSCEKQIEIELDPAPPRLVIDASMGFLTPCAVRLSMTQAYWNNELPDPVTGAVIYLSDTEGNKEKLHEYNGEGVYVSKVRGKMGETYTLTVEVNGEVYSAKDKIPTKVPIDKISFFKMDTGADTYFYPCLNFTDPEGESNYYYYTLMINGKLMQKTKYETDKNSDGLIKRPILMFDKEENDDRGLTVGDVIYIEMEAIGEGAYNFYKTASPPGGSSTSNPASNFSGDVLGMFKTYTKTTAEKTITAADLAE